MRLNLYWRGRDVLDIEAHVWRRRPGDPESFVDATGSDIERAEDAEIDTKVSLPFGFGRADA